MRHVSILALAVAGAMAVSSSAALAQNSSDCKVDWSKLDANNDGHVSRQEVQGSVEATFKGLDLDSNGQISETEYRTCQMVPIFYDRDGTMKWSTDSADAGQPAGTSDSGSADSAAKGTAAGSSASDSTQASNNAGLSDAQLKDRIKWFESADDDTDRYVTSWEASKIVDESLTVGGDDRSKAEVASRGAAYFSQLDRNGDGKVSRDEATSAEANMVPETSAMKADTNGDGVISMDEWAKHATAGYDAAKKASAEAKKGAGTGDTSAKASGSASSASTKSAAADNQSDPTVWYYFVEVL